MADRSGFFSPRACRTHILVFFLGSLRRISLENVANAVATVGSGSGSEQTLGQGLYQRFPHGSWVLRPGDHVSFQLIAPDEPPVAADDEITTAEDTAVVIPVTANDQRGSAFDPTTTVVTAMPASGSLVHHGDGTFTYEPAPDFHGTDHFTYEVRSAGGLTDSASVTIEVTPQRDALDDAVTLAEDSLAAFHPLGNDTFADSDAVIASFTQPAHGRVTAGVGGMLLYTPDPDYHGQDAFTYTVAAEPDGRKEIGTVNIQVAPVNDAPRFTPGPDQHVADDTGPRTVDAWATRISPGPDNESDQRLAFVVTVDNPSLFGEPPVISSDGTLRYTPAPGASGTALVRVVAVDNGGTAAGGRDTSSAQTFTVTFQTELEAAVDVKPRQINLRSQARVPIEILSTQRSAGEPETLDATLTDLSTLKVNGVTVEPAGAIFEDVDGDGDEDLVVRFRAADLIEHGAIDAETVDIALTAELADGTPWRGSDEVSTKLPPGHHGGDHGNGNGNGNGNGPGHGKGNGRGRR